MISVITITYNNISELKKTVNSVIKFSSLNGSLIKELVIVDNLSVDGTDSFVKKLNIPSVNLIYHRDSDVGVYDAMNKGVALAKNDFVIFINSGDLLVNSIDEKDIIDIYSNKCAGVAFSCLYSFNNKTKIVYPRNVNKKFPRLPGLHQGMLYKRKVLASIKYDLNFKICGDFDNVCRIYGSENNNIFLTNNKIISSLESGGISSLKPLKLYKESTGIVKNNNNVPVLLKLVFYLRLFFRLLTFQLYFIINQLLSNK